MKQLTKPITVDQANAQLDQLIRQGAVIVIHLIISETTKLLKRWNKSLDRFETGMGSRYFVHKDGHTVCHANEVYPYKDYSKGDPIAALIEAIDHIEREWNVYGLPITVTKDGYKVDWEGFNANDSI